MELLIEFEASALEDIYTNVDAAFCITLKGHDQLYVHTSLHIAIVAVI